MKFLIFSQSGNETLLADGICIGERKPNLLIGDKVKEIMNEKNIEVDSLIHKLGSNYSDTLRRVTNNEEIPKPKFVKQLCSALEVDENVFQDKELKNVLITDRGIVVATYDNDEKALEVKKGLDKYISENYSKNIPIVINLREE